MKSEVIAEPDLNVKRGLVYTLICCVIGFVCAIVGGFILIPVLNSLSYGEMVNFRIYNLTNFLRWMSQILSNYQSVRPVVGVIAIMTASGWANYAPKGEYRFAATLGIISVFSVPLIFMSIILLMSLNIIPQGKRIDVPVLTFEEYVCFIGSPLLVAYLLSRYRAKAYAKSIQTNTEVVE